MANTTTWTCINCKQKNQLNINVCNCNKKHKQIEIKAPTKPTTEKSTKEIEKNASMKISLLVEEEQKYPQVELQIETPVKSTQNESNDFRNNPIVHYQQCHDFNITYKVNDLQNEITVNFDEHQQMVLTNTCCLYFKYRKEFLMDHRRQRFNIILVPVYIIFILLCAVIGIAIDDMLHISGKSYKTNPDHVKSYRNVSDTEINEIKMCGIWYDGLLGWFDGNSFNINDRTWNDYSVHENNINSTYILNQIKLGLFERNTLVKDLKETMYIYGAKYDSINMPSVLSLNKNNYTIITIVRYNGNDKNTIFVSDDGKSVFGFKNRNGLQVNTNHSTALSPKYKNGWIINVDSTTVFRSQQQTLFYHKNSNNDTNSIKWGINSLNSSSWAVLAIMLFDHQLSLQQIECMENFMINKYNLPSNHIKTQTQNENEHSRKISECEQWNGVNYNYIQNWYDVNDGFNGDTLFDLSSHLNHIVIDENIKVGVDNNFYYMYGSSTDMIHLPNIIYLNDQYWTSIYYVARYNGNNKGSILVDNSCLFYFGFFDGNVGVCFLNKVKLSKQQLNLQNSEWLLSSIYFDNNNYVWYCTQNCETFSIDDVSFDDVHLNLTVNGQYNSDWALTELIVVQIKKDHNSLIPFVDTMCIEQYLSNKYNIHSYQYKSENILSLQFLNVHIIILILFGGILVN
eukprot:67140_1